MIKSYWLRLLIFAVVGAGIGLCISLASPKKYEAVVQILIDQAIGVPPPHTTDAEQKVMDILNSSRPRSITTQVEQLTSYGVLTTAAERAASYLQIPVTDPELDVENLMQSIIVGAEATSDLITLRVRMSSTEAAQTMAREIYRAFEEQNTRNSREVAGQAMASVETLKKALSIQLDIIDAQMQDLRLRGGAGANIEDTVTADISSAYKMRDTVDSLAISYAGQVENLKVLEAELARVPHNIDAASGEGPNPNILGLERDRATLRSQRASLLDRYLPDHPLVISVDLQLTQLNKEIAALEQRIDQGKTNTPNPLRNQLLGQVASARGSVEATGNSLAQARSALARVESAQQRFPDILRKYQRLLREQSVLERKYMDATMALQGLTAVQRARTSPTSLVTDPQARREPVSPKHLINLLFGLVGGLVLGVLSMLSTEGKRQPIRSLAQLNSLATQAVYRVIPELRMPFRGLAKAPAEPYETLLVNFRRSEKRPYRLGVVGITQDSGASITALNVALAAEKHGNQALIVETDERSTIRRLISRQGLATEGLLTKITPSVTLYATESLRQVQNPDGSSGFGREVQELESDLTIFDFEPATESAEYAFAASQLDEMIVLVRAERTKSVEFLHAQQALSESGCPVITVVFARSSDLQLVTDAGSTYEQPKALAQ